MPIGSNFLHQVAHGNTVRERGTSVLVALVPFLPWLAVLCSTFERPGWLGLTALLSAWGAACLLLGAMIVLLCAMLLADLCAAADLEPIDLGDAPSAALAGSIGLAADGLASPAVPGRAAYARQALRLAADSSAFCDALAANASDAIVAGLLVVPEPGCKPRDYCWASGLHSSKECQQ